MVPRLSFVGSSPETKDQIEGSFLRQLAILERHLAAPPVPLRRPAGVRRLRALRAALRVLDRSDAGRDHARRARRTCWRGSSACSTRSAEGDFEPWAALEPTLLPLLRDEVGGVFFPWTAANARGARRGREGVHRRRSAASRSRRRRRSTTPSRSPRCARATPRVRRPRARSTRCSSGPDAGRGWRRRDAAVSAPAPRRPRAPSGARRARSRSGSSCSGSDSSCSSPGGTPRPGRTAGGDDLGRRSAREAASTLSSAFFDSSASRFCVSSW